MKKSILLGACAALAAASPAFAQEVVPAGGTGGLDVTVTVTGTSDYRYRGISLSDRDPALQGSVDVTYNGFYVGAWASSIAEYADTNVELDLYAGYAGEAGPIAYEIGAIAYLYPGSTGGTAIYEGTAALSYTLGPATARLEAFYAPDQDNLAGDNFYLNAGLRVGVSTTPLTVFASLGRERGSFYGSKMDWSFGVEATHGPFSASLGYFDTDLDGVTSGLGRNVRGGVVASVSFAL